MLRAHQSHFCLRVILEDRGFQSDVRDTQTETEQICQAELREWGNCPTCQRYPDGFRGNPGLQILYAALRLPPMYAQYDDEPEKSNVDIKCNNEYNIYKCHNSDIIVS